MLNEDIRQKLLSTLTEHKDGVSTLDLATKAGVNRITVSKYMAAMQAEGVVSFLFLGQSKIWKLKTEGVRPNIFVVDDEPHVVKLLRIVLAEEKYNVNSSYSGYEFLEKVKNKKPDLIILDVMMPGLDGFSVAEQLAQDGRFANVPIIFLSAKSSIQDRLRGINLGALYYITKPFSPKALKEKIDSVLHLQRSFLRNEITNLPKRKLFLEQQKELGLSEGYVNYRVELSNLDELEHAFGMLKQSEFLVLFSGILKDTLSGMNIHYIVGHVGNEFLVCLPKEHVEDFRDLLTKSLSSFLPFIYETAGCEGKLGKEILLAQQNMKIKAVSLSFTPYNGMEE